MSLPPISTPSSRGSTEEPRSLRLYVIFAAQDFRSLVAGSTFSRTHVAALVYAAASTSSVFLFGPTRPRMPNNTRARERLSVDFLKQSGLRFCAVADTSRDDLARSRI